MKLSETTEVLTQLEEIEKAGTLDNYKDEGSEIDDKEDLENQMLYDGQVALDFISTNQKQIQQSTIKHNKMFEDVVLVLIILSSIMLAVDNPIFDPNKPLMVVLKYIDIVFTLLFTIEASIKVIANGCIKNNLGPVKPYLSSSWN